MEGNIYNTSIFSFPLNLFTNLKSGDENRTHVPGVLLSVGISWLVNVSFSLPSLSPDWSLFLQIFWRKFYMHITLLPYMLFVLPIVSYLFDRPYNIRMKSRNCVASHNAVFPNPLLLLVSWGPIILPGILLSVLQYIHTAVLWVMVLSNSVGG